MARSAAMMTDLNQLRPPGSQLPLGLYVRRLWDLRHYAVAVAKARVESSNADTSLGKLWLLAEPVLFIAVYGTIFGLILNADRGVDNFIGFLATGQILFRHNAGAMQTAARSMTTFEGQIKSMAVPRALFPLTSVVSTLVDQLPAFVVMLGILVLTGEVPSITWFVIVPVVMCQFVLNAGVGMILARAVAHIPDLSNMLTHVFRALLYGSGVIFPIATFLEERENGEFFLTLLTVLNPIYCLLELGRWALMDIPPNQAGLAVVSALLWSAVTLVVGLVWIRGVELRYGFGQIRNAP